jgi:hypothetical protein
MLLHIFLANYYNSLEDNCSRKCNNHSSSQEIPHPLQNQKVQYHIHKSLPMDSILHPVHNVTPIFDDSF